MEHQAGGSVRVDAQGGWAPSAQPSILTPAAHIIKTEDATGWLCAPIDCSVEVMHLILFYGIITLLYLFYNHSTFDVRGSVVDQHVGITFD